VKNKFQLGDKVETIDDVVRGTITRLEEDLVTIKTSDGFQMRFTADELMKIETLSVMDGNIPDEARLMEKDIGKKKKGSRGKQKKAGNLVPMEVDLHIEKLISRPGQMSVDEILDYQIDIAKKQLEYAFKNRISNVVFIHGVGAGVLRSELQTLFRKYPGLAYRTANFRRYGMGATEVLITY
jgi:dsDNA-specific endonuclease/ATPase MutS2